MINRVVIQEIFKKLKQKKAILIIGPRQTGKTILLNQIIKKLNDEVLSFNGDNYDVQEMFTKITENELKYIIEKYKYVFFDEAQRIKNIGITIKIIIDNFKDIRVIATGSSTIGITDYVNEPLTGRKYELFLYPFSFAEMADYSNFMQEKGMLEQRMIYGYYPEIVMNDNKIELLKNLTDSYLYKDLFTFERIKKPHIIVKLLQALALQIGSQVSYNELSQIVGIDATTVEKYIDLLEKTFVVFKVSAYNRNYRRELKKSKKIYFYDTGIRNALISNFSKLNLRNDVGALWENFFMSERKKYLSYNKFYGQTYFWRTEDQQEIDLIEEQDGKLKAFEIKWNTRKKIKFPNKFIETYPDAELFKVTPDNFYEYLL